MLTDATRAWLAGHAPAPLRAHTYSLLVYSGRNRAAHARFLKRQRASTFLQQAARRWLARKRASQLRKRKWMHTALFLQRHARRILARRYVRLRRQKFTRIAEVRGRWPCVRFTRRRSLRCRLGLICASRVLPCVRSQDAGVIARLARHSRMVMEELASTSIGVEKAFAVALRHMPGAYVLVACSFRGGRHG